MSIPNTPKKINIIVLVAICVVLGIMFAVGSLKLSAFSRQKEPIRVVEPTIEFSAQNKAKIAPIGQVVGSKSGSKYHLPECPGAKAISDNNKVVFASPADAERAGYTPAANCPGLKPQ